MRSAATKAIRAGKVVDAAARFRHERRDRRRTTIASRRGHLTPPAGVDVIDLRRYTVITWMIDVHTHMTYFWTRVQERAARPTAQTGRR